MEPVKLDRARFSSRLQTLTAAWTWDLDVLVLVTGKACDEAQEQKTAAMHQWLLGIEFPDTAIALRKSGHVVFYASAKKSEYLQQLRGPEVSLITRSAGSAVDAVQLQEFAKLMCGGTGRAAVGLLQKEKHVGSFAEPFIQAFCGLSHVQVRECREEISAILAPKEQLELDLTRSAAIAAQQLMKDTFWPKLESVLDQELKRTNKAICEEVDKDFENEERMTKWGKQHSLDVAEMDIFYVSLQSSSPFELKPTVEPAATDLPMQGSYLLSMGLKYSEYSACISRTLLIDPTAEQKDAYNIALEVQKQVIRDLVPGALFKDVYLSARATVQQRKSSLVDHFVKSVGFVMGLEFKDPQLVLSEKSDRKVLAGMVFCVSVGFGEFPAAGRSPGWAVWLSDTVSLPLAGNASQLLTGGCSREAKDVMFEVDDGAPPAPPVQTPPSIQSASQGKAKTPAKPLPPKSTSKTASKKVPVEPQLAVRDKAQKRETKSNGIRQEQMAKSPGKTRSSRSHVEKLSISGTKLKETRTRQKNEQTKQDMSELQKLEDEQLVLREKKLAEIKARFSGSESRGARIVPANGKLSECRAYDAPGAVPRDARSSRLQVDLDAEAILVPICGLVVPFHVRTIKNMSKNQVDKMHFLRVNFFSPGQGKGVEDFPVVNGNRLYVRELCFRSQTSTNFDIVLRSFKEAQKRARQREVEGSSTTRGPAEAGVLIPLRTPHCLRDLHVRPGFGTTGGRRCVGTLEAHTNGFRFSARGGADKVDIFYSQVKHAIFEPCDNSLLVLIHLHLKGPTMLGKKKVQDVQFFAEAAAATEDLSLARGGSTYDPDEILEEQRERELKERLNKIFQDFTKKVQSIETCPLEFDIPFKELSFTGVPNKSVMNLTPCAKVLTALQEWPPFVLDLAEIDVVIFERVVMTLREFDIVFVKKDYEQSPIRITTIPTTSLPTIKRWLHEMRVVWYSCAMNMQWPLVMKEITKDLSRFAEDGGWDAWFPEGSDSGSDAGSEGCGQESDWNDDGESDGDEGGADGDSDFDAEEDDAESVPQSDDEEGMSWDELEREAERSDRKRDIEQRALGVGRAAVPTPPAKRPRR